MRYILASHQSKSPLFITTTDYELSHPRTSSYNYPSCHLTVEYGGNDYNVNGTPHAQRVHRLNDDMRNVVSALLEEASAAFKAQVEIVAGRPAPVASADPAPVSPEPTQHAVSGTASALDAAFMDAFAKVATDEIVERCTPRIIDDLIEKFGAVPRRIEVTSPRGTVQVDGTSHEILETLVKLVFADVPLFLTGGAGTGKSRIVQDVAKSLDLDFYMENAVTDPFRITGYCDANGNYHETEFYRAFKNGGVFLLDEIDASAPEVLVLLNGAIAQRMFPFPCGRIDAHPDFRVVASGNTYGTGADDEYVGRYQLDAATLNRFALIDVDYSSDIEDALAGADHDLADFVRDFRAATRAAGVKHVVSYRQIEQIRAIVDATDDVRLAVKAGLTKNLDRDDLSIIAKGMKVATGRYAAALAALVA